MFKAIIMPTKPNKKDINKPITIEVNAVNIEILVKMRCH